MVVSVRVCVCVCAVVSVCVCVCVLCVVDEPPAAVEDGEDDKDVHFLGQRLMSLTLFFLCRLVPLSLSLPPSVSDLTL